MLQLMAQFVVIGLIETGSVREMRRTYSCVRVAVNLFRVCTATLVRQLIVQVS